MMIYPLENKGVLQLHMKLAGCIFMVRFNHWSKRFRMFISLDLFFIGDLNVFWAKRVRSGQKEIPGNIDLIVLEKNSAIISDRDQNWHYWYQIWWYLAGKL